MLDAIEPQRGLRVLVVDDHADTLDSAAMVLAFQGHDVKTALNGGDAVALTMQFQPELALLDLAMPGLDGYRTAGAIIALALPNPPMLVAVSGHGDAASRRRAADAGFDLHLLKPVHPSVFEELPLLVNDAEPIAGRFARLERREAISALASSYMELAYTMLDLARTTGIEATRERCLTRARRICERLAAWIERYHLQTMQRDLEDLIRHAGGNRRG